MRITFATLLACLVILALGNFALPAPSPQPTAKPTTKAAALSKAQQQKLAELKASAPADEYFGKMKLSFLGINNTFRDQAIRAGDHTTNPSVTGPLGWAEDALRAWQKKYSKDPQLARSYYLAFLADRKIWLADFQQRATTYLVALRQKFPTTFFGKQAKADLQKGMTMNFYAPAMPCDTSAPVLNTPAPLPTDDVKNNIKVNAIPVPCYTIAPSPIPLPGISATPIPEVSPTPAPASLTPTPISPTNTPASPTPTPSASASATPT